ncbi:hypothetical protein H4R18_005420 [Coemansia javaensis]|uniref:Uncharacterized protein n=1 Tax=Coemansia javaensis TaxID=2761396 RepID=A0A9W8H382_9FUNG|nr:hypothetical protein H4R18_005420 [Coemansia javaensis]
MAENAQAEPQRTARARAAETPRAQKGEAAKRRSAPLQHSHKKPNQHAAAGGGEKKAAKMEIPVSLDIDPFAAESYRDPQGAVDKMLSDKAQPDARAAAGDKDAAALLVRARKAETEVLTLKHQLLETKTELKAAEARLREKDAMIKDQAARIDDLIESRVPRDDMDEVMADNARLKTELAENEALLADCQKLLEEYVAVDAQ